MPGGALGCAAAGPFRLDPPIRRGVASRAWSGQDGRRLSYVVSERRQARQHTVIHDVAPCGDGSVSPLRIKVALP